MGVPRFFGWLCKNYRSTVSDITGHVGIVADHFYLDLNGNIHDAIAKLISTLKREPTNDEIYEEVFQSIVRLCEMVVPVDIFKPNQRLEELYIAIDGVAPLGKCNQQRQRRLRAVLEGRSFSNIVSAGTPFMVGLHAFLLSKEQALKQIGINKITFSSSEEPGEGEHKCFWKLRSEPTIKKRSIIIHAVDADLIFLGLGCYMDRKGTESIYILRKN